MKLIAYNQVAIPNFMYGTAWKKAETSRLVQMAVKSGFTAIDTANQLKHYDEALVGDALQALKEQGVPREDLFLQTKFTAIGGQDHRLPYDASADLTTQVKQSMDSSLAHLHAEFVDSYVLHGPCSRYGLGDEDWEVWSAIEGLYNAGKTKIIGVSNVSAEQLNLLCSKAKTKPMVVQNRCYASMGWDKNVRDICRAHKIIYQGFSLLTANQQVLVHPAVKSIAARLGCGPARVIFSFAMQIGMLPLTGTTSGEHMKDDLEAQPNSLTAEEMRAIETIAA